MISLSYQLKEPYRTASVLIAGDNFGADPQLPRPDPRPHAARPHAHRREDVVHRGNMRRALRAGSWWEVVETWRDDGEISIMGKRG